MGWSDTWYPNARAALTELRGVGPRGSDGQDHPALSAIDTVSVLGQITPAVALAIRNFNAAANGEDDASAAWQSKSIMENGARDPFDYKAVGLTSKAYLAAYPNPGVPHLRSATQGGWALGDTYEVWSSREPGLLGFTRQLIADWQHACDASAAAMIVSGVDLSTTMQADEADHFWAMVAAVCADLDVLAENPPVLYMDQIKAALRSAVDETEKFIGGAIADVSHEVGKTAGNVAEGFFAEAGLLSVAVAGIVIFLFLK